MIKKLIAPLDFQSGNTSNVANEIILKGTKYKKARLFFWPIMMRGCRLQFVHQISDSLRSTPSRSPDSPSAYCA